MKNHGVTKMNCVVGRGDLRKKLFEVSQVTKTQVTVFTPVVHISILRASRAEMDDDIQVVKVRMPTELTETDAVREEKHVKVAEKKGLSATQARREILRDGLKHGRTSDSGKIEEIVFPFSGLYFCRGHSGTAEINFFFI